MNTEHGIRLDIEVLMLRVSAYPRLMELWFPTPEQAAAAAILREDDIPLGLCFGGRP